MRVLCCFLLLILIQVHIESKNVIYVMVEGMSRHTFYPMLESKKLPHYQQIIQRGNFRNLGMQPAQLTDEVSTKLLYSGFESNRVEHSSFLQFVKQQRPQLAIKCFFSAPIDKPYMADTHYMVQSLLDFTQGQDLEYQASKQLALDVAQYIKNSQSDFFIMLNFTNVDYFGYRYREGADIYSKAVKNTDKALGIIIDALIQTNQFEQTEFLLTTNYGYRKKTPFKVAESWIAGTQKALRKGQLTDVFPSLLDLLDIEDQDYQFLLQGKTLFE